MVLHAKTSNAKLHLSRLELEDFNYKKGKENSIQTHQKYKFCKKTNNDENDNDILH